MFVEVTGENLVGSLFDSAPLIQKKVNLKLKAQEYMYICTKWKFKNLNLNSQ